MQAKSDARRGRLLVIGAAMAQSGGAMAYHQLEPFSRQITIVIGLTVVGFMALGLALSFYRNVLFDQTLSDLDGRNAELRESIAASRRQLEYYASAQYKDKYAKENLDRVNADERVLILAAAVPNPLAPSESEAAGIAEQQEAAFLELLKQMPVVEHWNLYLFHPEEVERLRESFEES